MKKLVLCVCVYLVTAFSFKSVTASETITISAETNVSAYISRVYAQIDFGKNDRLPLDVFDKAYRGYLNLQNAGKLNNNKHLLTICDFTKSSAANRLWIIDLATKKVVYNTYVAHGQGSGEEFATAFSNNNDSHQSSLGFYVTGETYIGEHGTSLHLMGQDNGFNDAAYDRGIVVHGADYVSGKFIAGNQRLGRSWGCPAVPSNLSASIINTIKDGTCLFIYYPEKNYLKKGYWLNKHIDNLPENAAYPDFRNAVMPITSIKYVTNGKIDSVVAINTACLPK